MVNVSWKTVPGKNADQGLRLK